MHTVNADAVVTLVTAIYELLGFVIGAVVQTFWQFRAKLKLVVAE